MRIFLSLLILFQVATLSLSAQNIDMDNAYSTLYWGIEQDPQPYFFKGWTVSAWMGLKRARIKGNFAAANTPAFFRRPGINFERTNASHVGIDFFFKDQFKGFWVGPSLGYWWNRIKSEDHYQKDFWSAIFSVGTGYNIYIFKGLYISPYLAGHLRITGTKNIMLGPLDYTPRLFTPEISLKIGWRFGNSSN
jgi:hypothetical protein